mmetsp:Transcript_19287/g.45055  ORF Transcript_19287/g.45055 Transcript_19287/m.45055 type:complete len:259 (+) Transcript_19287:44-820(+)
MAVRSVQRGRALGRALLARVHDSLKRPYSSSSESCCALSIHSLPPVGRLHVLCRTASICTFTLSRRVVLHTSDLPALRSMSLTLCSVWPSPRPCASWSAPISQSSCPSFFLRPPRALPALGSQSVPPSWIAASVRLTLRGEPLRLRPCMIRVAVPPRPSHSASGGRPSMSKTTLMAVRSSVSLTRMRLRPSTAAAFFVLLRVRLRSDGSTVGGPRGGPAAWRSAVRCTTDASTLGSFAPFLNCLPMPARRAMAWQISR